jgi:hypothetical protein
VIAVRPAAPGATRSCPHCRATVLQSASVCPACQHHLRFNAPQSPSAAAAAALAASGYAALQVEGTVRHKQPGEPCEFCVVLTIANEQGEQISRQVVGVGVLRPSEVRRFSVAVNLVPARSPGLKLPIGR